MSLKSTSRKNKYTKMIVIGGLLIIAAVVLSIKPSPEPTQAGLSLEIQLDTALQENRPTFVFLHSMDCIPCQEMMEIVDLVYPEYEDQVVLIDVDVYDINNENILRREALQAIPTLVFYDRAGERYLQIGVLPADQLRIVFQTLSGD